MHRDILQRSCIEISSSDLAKRPLIDTLYRDLARRSLRAIIDTTAKHQHDDYTTKTPPGTTYWYQGGTTEIPPRKDPVKEILRVIFCRNLQNLPWHLFVMFLATVLGVSCRDNSPTAKLCYGVFSPDYLWCDPVQLQHQVPDKVPEGSGAAQKPGEVPKGSGADTWWGSGRFRWRVRFQKVPVQRPCEVREGSGADTWWGSGSFRRRCLVRFRRVPAQIPWEVPEGGADALWSSKRFRRFLWHKHLIPQQQSSGEASGEFWRNVDIRFLQVWCAIQIVFCQVPVQHPKVPEGTGVWYWKKCWNYHAVGDSTWVFSPHLCVGFLFLVVHSRLPPPPSPAASCTQPTHTQLVHTQLAHTQPPPHNLLTHTTCPRTTAHTQLVRTHNSFTHSLLTHNLSTHTTCSHTHTTCPHTTCSHTHNLSTHNLLTHNLSTHTTCSHTHNLSTRNLLTHNLSTHNLLTHNLSTHNLLTHTQLVHTQLAHTQLVHTQLTHTQLVHTHNLLTHNLFTRNLLTHTHTACPHTTLSHIALSHTTCSHTHNLLTHNLSTHNLLTHTTCPHTTCPHTTYSRTQLVYTQLVHTQLTHTGVAGVALGDIHVHSACRRGAWRHWLAFCVAGVALEALGRLWWRAWVPVDAVDAAAVWQAWHLATSACILRGRRGAWRHRCVFCVAGVAVMALGSFCHRPLLCLAGVALGDIDVHSAWQAWQLATWTFTLRGRCGTGRHRCAVCLAGVTLVQGSTSSWAASALCRSSQQVAAEESGCRRPKALFAYSCRI